MLTSMQYRAIHCVCLLAHIGRNDLHHVEVVVELPVEAICCCMLLVVMLHV